MIVTTGVVYQLAKIKNFGVSYLTPVSYTHLDVYKRQPP